jgi:hypothetical protein
MSDPTARDRFEELAAEHLSRPGTGRRTMFGRDCLMVNGSNIAFFHDDRLALKLPADRTASLLASGEATTPLMGKRAMHNWVAVPLTTVERWRELLGEAAAAAD